MIEKFLKHELSIRKWRNFKSRRLAMVSVWLLGISCFFSYSAEWWANSKPLILSYNNEIYFPIIKNYPAATFNQFNQVTTDYRAIDFTGGDWAVWPIIKWDPFESNKLVDSYPSPPSQANWLGTDDRGRDLLTRLLYGLRYSITYSFFVWIITFFLGTIAGGVMGWKGGAIDFWGQRLVEVLSTVPQFFLLIIIIAIFKPTLWLLIIISCIFGWIGISYYVRGEFLKNRKMDFVEGARAIGAGEVRLFFKHLLPNSLGPLITFTPFVISGNIVGLASLDYLGFGLTPPTPSWGELLNQAQQNFTIGWWLAVFPSLAMFATLTMLSLIGEATRDVMDPRQ
ncbi:MAG: ABC transporter permease subunit [Bacteriovoracaceae bacterium]|nr:ABC transporter permease subunit [Bacteriovoracaceae bacterium]